MSMLFNHAIAPLVRPRLQQRAAAFLRQNPLHEQEQIIFSLLKRGAETRFGRDHGFKRLPVRDFAKTYERYCAQVPIRTYADFQQDYFRHATRQRGEERELLFDNLTWPGRIPFFCETSGTTAPSKYIPFSREMFTASRAAAFDLIACYLAVREQSRLLDGRLLYMSGSTRTTRVGPGVESGDMSALTLKHRPWYLQRFIAPDNQIAGLPWEEKLAALVGLLQTDPAIRAISGVPPWILLLLQKTFLSGAAPLPPGLPQLELIIHGGTTLTPYAAEFDRLFPASRPDFLEVYPASEGFMGFQVFGEKAMRLTPFYGIFFEFVPARHLATDGSLPAGTSAVPLAGVVPGERYAVILSTCAGLWRYLLGDTVRFTSIDPYFFEFTGRDRLLDTFEEKVTQAEVEEAIVNFSRVSHVAVHEFMTGPQVAARRHLWILAVDRPDQFDRVEAARFLDAELIRQNADYALFRGQERIAPPQVLPVAADTIYGWSKAVRKRIGGQSKIPHIDPNRDGCLTESLADFSRLNKTI